MFFICAVIYIIGMIAFTILGSAELQPWAIKHTNNSDINNNNLLSSMLNISFNIHISFFFVLFRRKW